MNEQRKLYELLDSKDSLNTIQEYVKKVIDMRGFGVQPVEQTLLLMTEEVGELTNAIRKEKTTMSINKNKIHHYDCVEEELADVFYCSCVNL